jgi:hypothetical protein
MNDVMDPDAGLKRDDTWPGPDTTNTDLPKGIMDTGLTLWFAEN